MTNKPKQAHENRNAINFIVSNVVKSTSGLIKISYHGSVGVIEN